MLDVDVDDFCYENAENQTMCLTHDTTLAKSRDGSTVVHSKHMPRGTGLDATITHDRSASRSYGVGKSEHLLRALPEYMVFVGEPHVVQRIFSVVRSFGGPQGRPIFILKRRQSPSPNKTKWSETKQSLCLVVRQRSVEVRSQSLNIQRRLDL